MGRGGVMKRFFAVACLLTTGLVAADRIPLVLEGSIPTYPQLAISAHISGKVRVGITVSGGVVSDVRVLHSDNRLLTGSTLDAVRSWKFASSTNTDLESEFVYELGKPAGVVP